MAYSLAPGSLTLRLNMRIVLFIATLFTCCLALYPTKLNAEGVEIIRFKNPAQKTYNYAGKLRWDEKKRQWKRTIVIYNSSPKPPANHAVWHYVWSLKTPSHFGKQNQQLFYKPFFLKENCRGHAPLALRKAWHIDFDKLAVGEYTQAQLRKDWNCPQWFMGRNLLHIIAQPHAFHGKSLRLRFPKGISGCYSKKHCVNWKPEIGNQFKKLYFGFRFKFPKGFDFVKGGKLPGIGGGKANTGGKKPNGVDGWSVRMMWNGKGKLVQYVYHPDQPGKYGEAFAWEMDSPIERGKWHTIQTMVLLNRPGKKDGAIRSWLNDKEVLFKQGIRFRNTDKLEIDRFLFDAFFGGSGANWAPRKDEYLFIDDVRLSVKPPFFK